MNVIVVVLGIWFFCFVFQLCELVVDCFQVDVEYFGCLCFYVVVLCDCVEDQFVVDFFEWCVEWYCYVIFM